MATEAKEDVSAEEFDATTRALEKELAKPLEIADQLHLLSLPDTVVSQEEKVIVAAALRQDIVERGMAPFYLHVCEMLKWPVDEALLEQLRVANAAELAKLDATLTDALENLGQNEQLEAYKAKAEFLARIGEKDKVFEVYEAVPPKITSKGQKTDIALHEVRIGLFHADFPLVRDKLHKAAKLIEEGGDWDRRNRLKVYKAVYYIATREFKKAVTLLLESVATFSAIELFSFSSLVQNTVLMGVHSLDRATLKKRVIDSPDVQSAVRDHAGLAPFLLSIHECQYKDFFAALGEVYPVILRNRYLSAHVSAYVRDIRVKAYGQFLDAYLSVTSASMAASFGVSVDFLDAELFHFISANKVNAKIDKISGVIVTNRPDKRNGEYQAIIRTGDLLLNKIQRLARVVSM